MLKEKRHLAGKKQKKIRYKSGTEHRGKVWLIYPKKVGFLIYFASYQQQVLYMVAETMKKSCGEKRNLYFFILSNSPT